VRSERPVWIAVLQPTVNGRYGEVVPQFRDVGTALTERQRQNMLQVHQAAFSAQPPFLSPTPEYSIKVPAVP